MNLLALLLAPAHAAEVDLEGYYRSRFRVYDTLSLNHELTDSEGTTSVVEHRLWLRPNIYVNDKVAVRFDLLGLDGVDWGQSPARYTDPVTDFLDPIEFGDQLTPPTPGSEADERDFFRDFTLAHAWTEVDTDLGRFSFGRMPLHWGLGVWHNDGLGHNGDLGDSADRVMWDRVFDDVFVQVAIDANAEGLVNGEDDTFSVSGATGYRTELINTGLVAHYRRTPSRGVNLLTLDAAFAGEIGTLDLGAEAIGRFGRGEIEIGGNAVDASVLQFGGVLDALMHTRALDIGLEAGLASGDPEPDDTKLGVFTFDRDYEVGLVMFEQPMPTLNGLGPDGRDYTATASGTGVSNATFLKPRASRVLSEEYGVTATASWLTARTLNPPAEDRAGYGNEFDVRVRWEPDDNVLFDVTGGLFLPGGFYTEHVEDQLQGFDDPVWACQIIGEARF